ncbi:hypothetical protein ARMSODRAFT_922591, partial [Armillaria solidipes]
MCFHSIAQEPVEGGPKTAEFPPEDQSTTDFFNLLDISPDLKLEQRASLERVLFHNRLAFGLDGRLGNHDALVKIELKPGSEPVSLPPFPVSPANRDVMNKQIDAWIQLGVIEPSKSPWGAPAFIAYRNNK